MLRALGHLAAEPTRGPPVVLPVSSKGGARRPSVHRSPPAGPPRPGRRVVLVLDEEETAPPPPPDTLRAEVAKGVKKFLLQ